MLSLTIDIRGRCSMPRVQADTNKRAVARIQRLCCLGIGGEMLMPDLLREVGALLRARHYAFRWAGPYGEIANDCSSFPLSHTELYLKEFNESPEEARVINSFSAIRTSNALKPLVTRGENTLRVDLPEFMRSEYYNLLWRAVDIHYQLILVARDAVRKHGMLYVYRSAGDPPFDGKDIRMLEAIGGFVAHSMIPATREADAFVETEDRALLVATPDGRLIHATEDGERLLRMALDQRFSAATPLRGGGDTIPEIVGLCRALAATAEGRIGQPPPVRSLRNDWGLFVLRAYWLGPTDGTEQTRHIGITIDRRVPRVLALLRRIEELPLTAREKQLCLLLSQDPSRQDLADAMGLANSTVITHQRSIYAKLGVHSRSGLVASLRADA
jgi:DNA-binding CsgD family transcriptional regulator